MKENESLFNEYGLRYDITQISPGLVGREFIKTIGHYHKDFGSEIYEVLSGEAIFIFQKIDFSGMVMPIGGQAEEIYLIKANVGEKVVVPWPGRLPGYGHVTINPGNDFLVVADISSENMRPNYDFFKKYRGAAYYIVKGQGLKINDNIAAVKNTNYSEISNLEMGTPKEVMELGISFSKPLYASFIEAPEKFDFIIHPEKYKEILAPEKLFKLSK